MLHSSAFEKVSKFKFKVSVRFCYKEDLFPLEILLYGLVVRESYAIWLTMKNIHINASNANKIRQNIIIYGPRNNTENHRARLYPLLNRNDLRKQF